jgi:hypothetical protein
VDPLPEDVDAGDVVFDDPSPLEEYEADPVFGRIISNLEQIEADALPDAIAPLIEVNPDALPDAVTPLIEVDPNEALGFIACNLDYSKQGIDAPVGREPAEEGVHVALNRQRVAEEKYHNSRHHLHVRTWNEQGKTYQQVRHGNRKKEILVQTHLSLL